MHRPLTQPCGITMETRFKISFLLTCRLTVKLVTLFVDSGLGQHAIGFLKSCLGILSRLVLSGPSAYFHLERYANKQSSKYKIVVGAKINTGFEMVRRRFYRSKQGPGAVHIVRQKKINLRINFKNIIFQIIFPAAKSIQKVKRVSDGIKIAVLNCDQLSSVNL